MVEAKSGTWADGTPGDTPAARALGELNPSMSIIGAKWMRDCHGDPGGIQPRLQQLADLPSLKNSGYLFLELHTVGRT